MQTSDEVLDLDAFDRPVGRIKFRGHTHDILPANGKVVGLVQQMATATPDGGNVVLAHLSIGRQVAAEAVPTMSDEDRSRLGVEQVTAIVALTTRQVDQVRAMIREAEGNADTPVVVGDAVVEPLATETEREMAATGQ